MNSAMPIATGTAISSAQNEHHTVPQAKGRIHDQKGP